VRVAILHNAVAPGAGAAERDVLDQVAAVKGALEALGWESWPVACDLDLEKLRRGLEARPPELVFNLVESLGGQDRLIHLVPSLLDALAIPYTGCGAEALWTTTDKLGAKRKMAAAGLPTPAVGGSWPRQTASGPLSQETAKSWDRRWIIKSTWEHGSPALGDDAVVGAGQLERRLRELAPAMGGSCFAEEYVEGREFNLSLLQERETCRLLPAVEMMFVDFPAGKPRIVGAAAKWQEGSFEYRNTRHRFDFPAEDQPLLAELGRLASRCWQHFGLAGWARVDFRVDSAGRPFILEINANPCLSADAGFAVALARAGLTYDEGIQRIVEAAVAAGTLDSHSLAAVPVS
jgi:D-alanine-D-alanine ligase